MRLSPAETEDLIIALEQLVEVQRGHIKGAMMTNYPERFSTKLVSGAQTVLGRREALLMRLYRERAA